MGTSVRICNTQYAIRNTHHVLRFTFHVLRTGFIVFALMAFWTVAPGEALGRTIDLFSFSPTGTDVLLKAFEGDQTATVILTKTYEGFKPQSETDSEAFRRLLLGEKYNQSGTIKTFQKQVGMEESASDGQFGLATWTAFVTFLRKLDEKESKETDALKDLGVEKLASTNVDQLLKAPVDERYLTRLIQFSMDQKEMRFIAVWLNGDVKLTLPSPFAEAFITALAKKRVEIARWQVQARQISSITQFVGILDKGYTPKSHVTDELIQLVILLNEHDIKAADPYKTLLVTYLRENQGKFSIPRIRELLNNRPSGDWEQVVKAELIKGVSGVVIIVAAGVGVLIIAGVLVLLFQRGVIPSRRRKRQEYDIMDEAAAQLPRGRGRRHPKPSEPLSRQQTVKPPEKPPQVDTSRKGEMEPPSEPATKPYIREGEAPAEPAPTPPIAPDVTELIRTTLAAEMPTLVKTVVEEAQLQGVLAQVNRVVEVVKQAVEEVKAIRTQVNDFMFPPRVVEDGKNNHTAQLDKIDMRLEAVEARMLQQGDIMVLQQAISSLQKQIDSIAAQKVVVVREQMDKLVDEIKNELARKAVEAGKQLDQKQGQLQATLNQIDPMLKEVLKHIDAWKAFMDEKQTAELQRQHLKFDEILNVWNADFNATLATLSPESSQRLPVLQEILGKVEGAEQLISAIVEEACDRLAIEREQCGEILDAVDRLKAELNQAVQLHQPLPEPAIQSFGEYCHRLGSDALPGEKVYEDYLRQLSDSYRDYFKRATNQLKMQVEMKSQSADYFLERFERFATDTVVAFTTFLDNALKKAGIPSMDSIESTLQQLFNLIGLEEIRVNEKQEKYDSLLHEAIRWVNEGELERDTIIQVVRRGFSFKNGVLRRARVVVRQ